MANLPDTVDPEMLKLLPADECWDIPNMPHRCATIWQKWHFSAIDSGDTGLYILGKQIATEHLPAEKRGTPKAPSKEQCGPLRDGVWISDEQGTHT